MSNNANEMVRALRHIAHDKHMLKRISEIQARCEAATPGPWFTHESHNWHKDPPSEYFIITQGIEEIIASWVKKEDAAFIAHSREDIPYLLAELERLRETQKRDVPAQCIAKTINRGIGITGEYDIDAYLLCPSCCVVVGDAECEELNGSYCHQCGQRLELPAVPESKQR